MVLEKMAVTIFSERSERFSSIISGMGEKISPKSGSNWWKSWQKEESFWISEKKSEVEIKPVS